MKTIFADTPKYQLPGNNQLLVNDDVMHIIYDTCYDTYHLQGINWVLVSENNSLDELDE